MKCFYHNDKDATATCRDCGKALCSVCTGRFSRVLCEECLLKNNKAVVIEIYQVTAISIIIFAATAWLFKGIHEESGARHTLALACLPAMGAVFTYLGWKFLSKRKAFLLIGSPVFWLFYLFIKLFIANMIGLFVGPYMIFKMIKDFRNARKTTAQIVSGEI